MRYNKMFNLIILSVILISTAVFPLYADQDIYFKTETIEMVKNTDKPVEIMPAVLSDLHLVIGKDFFQVNENGLVYIYNFSNRKIFVIDPKSKIYEVYSLYTYIGFRTAEMENRLLVYDNFRLSRDKDLMSYLKPVILEDYFSIKSNRNSEKIIAMASPGKITYSAEGVATLMETSREGKSISKNEMMIFLKFLKYRIGGHPEILEKINETSIIPDWFTHELSTDGRHVYKTHYKLMSIKNISESTYSLDGFRQGTVQFTGDFVNYINESVADVEKKSAQKIASIESEIKDAIDRKSYFEAVLGCMEIGLYNSRFDVPLCKTNLEQLQSDAQVKTFLNNLNTNEKENIEVSFQKLKELETRAHNKSFVLWVFEANLKARMGETQEAYNLYYQALKKNPYLTGVYKDIGEIFYNNYNMDMAWFCWDTGRKIFRDHSMLKEIDKLEENLTKKYPEFF